MTWSSSLICRGENLEKILLSNYALDHRKIFSRKCSSNLSESNLPSIKYPSRLTLLCKLLPLTLLFPLQFVQSIFHNVVSDEFLFFRKRGFQMNFHLTNYWLYAAVFLQHFHLASVSSMYISWSHHSLV